MIDFKDFLVTNPGMEKDAQIAYRRMKTRKSQDYGNDTASTDYKKDAVKEKMTAAQKKKRLDMIRKAVERINKANLEKAKKDALAAMKDMNFFEAVVNKYDFRYYRPFELELKNRAYGKDIEAMFNKAGYKASSGRGGDLNVMGTTISFNIYSKHWGTDEKKLKAVIKKVLNIDVDKL